MPSTLEKIRILGANSKYDICASTASSRTEKFPQLFGKSKNWIGATARAGICHSYTPDGRCMSLLKLYTRINVYITANTVFPIIANSGLALHQKSMQEPS